MAADLNYATVPWQTTYPALAANVTANPYSQWAQLLNTDWNPNNNPGYMQAAEASAKASGGGDIQSLYESSNPQFFTGNGQGSGLMGVLSAAQLFAGSRSPQFIQ